MALLLLKVLLAPAAVVLASLVARRFGPRLGGLAGGLPVVAGPILLVDALVHGQHFAAVAASNALLGIISLLSYIVVYAHLSGRLDWRRTLPLSWTAFLLATLALSSVPYAPLITLAIVAAGLSLAPKLMPSGGKWVATAPMPRWDIPLRAGSAILLVVSLTAVAGWIGPQLSGLLTPFPVIGSVLAAFTHARYGRPALVRLLRGLLVGYVGFSLFCFTLAVSLPLGIAASFGLACVVALSCQGLMLWRQRVSVIAEALEVAESA